MAILNNQRVYVAIWNPQENRMMTIANQGMFWRRGEWMGPLGGYSSTWRHEKKHIFWGLSFSPQASVHIRYIPPFMMNTQISWWNFGHFGHSYAMLRLTTPMWGRDQIRLSWHRTSWPLHHHQQKCCLPGIKVVLGDPRTWNREKLTHITWLTFGLMRYKYIWLVVEPTPLKNMSSSVGIIVPNWMEN